LVHSASQARHAAVTQAEAIIETRVQGFMHWLENRTIVPIIQQLNQSAEALCMAEVGRAQRRLAQGEPAQQVLQSLAESLTHKYLHGPLTALNESDGSTRQQLLAWLPRLFPLQSRRRKS
jgi:glutamyl-tRNA reductase